MFEPNKAFKVFEEQTNDVPFTFLLADSEFRLGETASTFESMTGISQSQIQNFKNEKDREIACDDILHIQSYDCEFLDFKENYEPQEVEVVFRS